MKNLIAFSLVFLMVSCSKKQVAQKNVVQENLTVAPYDTVAIDSFSAGATTVDIARKIRISSLQYQDSLRQNLKKIEAEKRTLAEKTEKEKFEKKLEEEKKKADALKIKNQKVKTQPEVPNTENTKNP